MRKNADNTKMKDLKSFKELFSYYYKHFFKPFFQWISHINKAESHIDFCTQSFIMTQTTYDPHTHYNIDSFFHFALFSGEIRSGRGKELANNNM